MEVAGVEKIARYLIILGGVVAIMGVMLFQTGFMKKFQASGAPRISAATPPPRKHATSAEYVPPHGAGGDSAADPGPEGTFQRGAPDQKVP